MVETGMSLGPLADGFALAFIVAFTFGLFVVAWTVLQRLTAP